MKIEHYYKGCYAKEDSNYIACFLVQWQCDDYNNNFATMRVYDSYLKIKKFYEKLGDRPKSFYDLTSKEFIHYNKISIEYGNLIDIKLIKPHVYDSSNNSFV